MPSAGSGAGSTTSPPRDGPLLVPNLYLDDGRVVEAETGHFRPVLNGGGKPVDLFEVADRLAATYGRFCVFDLEGIRRNRPQLDYLQELSRSGELWVDAGIRSGDQVIDILVTGARRAILSTAFLLGTRELKRAWRLSTEILFAVETDGARIRTRGNDWDGAPTVGAIANARAVGVVDVVLRSRGAPVDWAFIQQLSTQGRVWVGGKSEAELRSQLAGSGAVGGFFDPSLQFLRGD